QGRQLHGPARRQDRLQALPPALRGFRDQDNRIYLASRLRRRLWTAGLRNSRNASEAIHRAACEFKFAISSAHSIAALLSAVLRLPIWRKAQLTAFFTKCRSSVASRRMMGRNRRNRASGAFLSCTARAATMAKAPRLTNSSSRRLQATAVFHANGALSK